MRAYTSTADIPLYVFDNLHLRALDLIRLSHITGERFEAEALSCCAIILGADSLASPDPFPPRHAYDRAGGRAAREGRLALRPRKLDCILSIRSKPVQRGG